MMLPALLAACLAVLSGPVVAHGGLANYTVGDTWYRGYDPSAPAEEQLGQPWMVQRQWASIDPIFDADDKFIACNNPGVAPPSYIPIEAGEDITAVYYYWLHPVGPMTVWLAHCGDDCATADVNEVGWFKIWEAGLLEGNLAEGTWYQKQFQRWDGSPGLWPVTIPKSLKAGLYMIRHEILSIHIEDKPQFYPECGHLNITTGGDVFPEEKWLQKFPGAYDKNDPSIKINVYTEEAMKTTNYTIPGGPVWTGA
ncbi:glycoside hydrolase family 61 protein [Cladorrhinum samala]|uniref:lytic cellulose monooxygenase (C4-dehydrogenating) n=1 Tax=Cladorrhinum samala TaxID=585594 RepID=A0AAV9HVB9_9PEZI|nr:glycoside hydrolase family 61 protein [Cladorrhinum samala]